MVKMGMLDPKTAQRYMAHMDCEETFLDPPSVQA